MAGCATAAVFDGIPSLSAPLGHTDSILIGEENLQEQQDEVLAIQAIYEGSDEERIQVISQPNDSGHGLFQIQVVVPVATPLDGCQVDIMVPSLVDTSPGEGEGGEAVGAVGGQTAEEGGAGKEEGARALTPPPDIAKGVPLQRSLSGQRWTGSFNLRYLCPMTLHLTLPPTYPSHDPPAFALSCAWLRRSQLSVLCRQLDKLWEANMNMPVIFSWVDWLENETFSCLGLTNNQVLMPEPSAEDSDESDVDGRAMSECSDLGQAIHTLLQYSNQTDAVEFCKNVQECCLCMDEKSGSKFFRLEPCKHHFCFDCIATHCSLHVAAGTVQLLTCPGYECNVVVSPDVLQTVLPPDAFIRWETLSLQRSLDQMDDVVYCPRCQAVVIREPDATLNLGYCLTCCFSFCTECEQQWHQGSACESDLERLDAKVQRSQLRDERARRRYEELRAEVEARSMSLNAIKNKTVRCPCCRVPVEKIEGCNKMTCRCGKSFCWLCGKAINGYDHFTSSSCVLFRYQPENVVQRVPERRPPEALLWMQARAEMMDNPRQREIRCPQCKQTNFKLDNNNHLRCWNCKSNLCFHCKGRVTGVITQHFVSGGCPQHS